MKLVKKSEEARKAEMAYSMVKNMDLPEDYRRSTFEIILKRSLSEPRFARLEKAVTDTEPDRSKSAAPKGTQGLLPGRIMELAPEGFFKEPKSASEVRSELRNRGYAYSFATVGMALLALTRRKELRRLFEKKGDREQYLYTNP